MDFKEEIVPETLIPPLPSTERGIGLHIDGTVRVEPRLLYCSNELVIQRNLENVNEVRINSEHAVKVKTAKFSPNGEWICSGDESGQVFVWAHKSFVVKNAISVGKCCLDIDWSADGQRIVAVGRGKDEKGKVFPWNTNNKLGELGGAQKGFLCCAFKPSRPFRVITGSEDYGVYYYKGPPFKFETACNDHSNYVNGVAFSPDGSIYISVSSDKKIFAFDSKTGKKIKIISNGKGKNNHHKGTIYEISFCKDGSKFITSSADKTCKIWDYDKGEVIFTYTFADKATKNDMQVSCLWLEDYILSISLSGKINYLDPTFNQERPIKIITGHKATINDIDYDMKHNTIYTCDTDGRVIKSECKSGECIDIIGTPHQQGARDAIQLKHIRTTCDSSAFYTIAVNDTVCKSIISADDDDDEKKGNGNGNVMGDKVLKLAGASRGCCTGNKNANLFIVPIHKKQIIFINDLSITASIDIKYTPISCALSNDDNIFAVSSGRDGENSVYFYDVSSQSEIFVLSNKQYIHGEIVAISFSANGEFLATADKTRSIWIWDISERKNPEKPCNFNKGMKFHNGLITSIQFSPDGKRLLTCANDSNIFLFTNPTQGKSENIHLDHAFPGLIRKTIFLSQNKIVSIGGDSSIRFFSIQPKK